MSFADLVAAMDRAAQENLGSVSIAYQPAVGPSVSVTGLFSDPFELAQGDALAGVETLGPSVFLRLADLPVDPKDDDPLLTIAGVTYRVAERKPDGMGGILLAIRKAG